MMMMKKKKEKKHMEEKLSLAMFLTPMDKTAH